eukprot:GHRQ01031388.1.p1 GENE.GHRQ01031388.1~~GHRQ01031388.1.p1  ORF type:complete len:230 (+),score=48.66 GHRQ01031388.1:412-1101(+)
MPLLFSNRRVGCSTVVTRSVTSCRPAKLGLRSRRAAEIRCSRSETFAGLTDRRQLLLNIGTSLLLQQAVSPGIAQELGGVQILDDKEGFGQHAVRQGDLVLVHYTGVVEETGEVFDSTRGGLRYRDGGRGVFRPLAFRLSGFPQPGVCEGLQQALVGMKIGGQRSVLVPPQLGFGGAAVLAPYAGVPANSVLRYDVELVRVSALGPDAMMKVSMAGAGRVVHGKCYCSG